VTIEPATPITEAAAIMAGRHIRRLPVVEQHANAPHPVGLITATDILHAYPPSVNPFAIAASATQQNHITTAQIMSRALQTVSPETPIEEAARIMRDEKISTLLVVQKMKLVGLITESDIFRAFLSILDFSRGDVRITFEIAQEEDIFGFLAPVALKWGVHVVSLMSVKQSDRKLCVVKVAGAAVDKMLDEIWSSGHHVLNVLRLS
jgi:acetoin utilization protein AcuB